MTCNSLGFGECDALRVNKSADTDETLVFPVSADLDFTNWTGELEVRESAAASTALLTITEAPNVNGSGLFLGGRYMTIRIKKADLATLPDADDPNEPWVGVYQFVVTDTFGLTSEVCAGAFIAEKGVVR